jgi:hypothetical protein
MPIRLHPQLDERLLILRALDQLRAWSSLDDERVCILCDKKFSGRQVAIRRNRSGQYEAHCPTGGCNAGPSQWVYPGNPLVSQAAYEDWQRAFANSDQGSASHQSTSIAA